MISEEASRVMLCVELSSASSSLIGNANLISKVYFPRLIVPKAAIVVSFVDFLISFTILIPFIVSMGLYVSPVGFSSAIIPEQWRLLYALNPVVGVIDGFRWAILGGEAHLYWPGFLLSWGLIAGFLWLGIRQFRNMEKGFADFI